MGALDIERKLGLPVLALANADEVRYYPSPATILEPGTRLVVLAERDQVERLRALVGHQDPLQS